MEELQGVAIHKGVTTTFYSKVHILSSFVHQAFLLENIDPSSYLLLASLGLLDGSLGFPPQKLNHFRLD